MEIKEEGIEVQRIVLTEVQSLHVCLKVYNGKLGLDVRKWMKYPNLEEYVPSKKGLMMDLEQWHQVIPIIQAMIDANRHE